jgi:hypothetical protein
MLLSPADTRNTRPQTSLLSTSLITDVNSLLPCSFRAETQNNQSNWRLSSRIAVKHYTIMLLPRRDSLAKATGPGFRRYPLLFLQNPYLYPSGCAFLGLMRMAWSPSLWSKGHILPRLLFVVRFVAML